MLRRTAFNNRGAQHNFGQVVILEGTNQQGPANRVANAAKLFNYVQLNDRENWLFQLGLSSSCAHKLAMKSLEHSEFNLLHLQQRWKRVCQLMGPERQAQADKIVLHEIEELLQRPAYRRECPRTPSPPRDIDWNQIRDNTPLLDGDEVNWGYSGPTANRYALQGNTSTPVSDVQRYQPDGHSSEPDNYNIDTVADIENNYRNKNRRSLDFDAYNSNGYNNKVEYRGKDVYDINEDPRYFRDDFHVQHPNYYENRNNRYYTYKHDDYNFDAQPRNMEENYSGRHSPNSADYHPNERIDNMGNNEQDDYGYPMQQQSYNTYHSNRNNQNYVYNSYSFSIETQFPTYVNQKRTYSVEYNTRHSGKRHAETLFEPDHQVQPKRRHMEQQTNRHRTEKSFQIGSFEIPHIRYRHDPLPQPEYKSYVIKFFQREHSLIIGEASAVSKNIDPKELRAKILGRSVHLSRAAGKQIRRSFRQSRINIYREKNYMEWDLWWQDYKWCEKAIRKELERYEGVDLHNKFLQNKLNYEREGSIRALMNMAQMVFNLNTSNYQSIMATIFELMNTDFLEKLRTIDMGHLQDLIRYLPNNSWIYMMRSMVYLWGLYSQIQTDSSDAKNLVVTQAQWNSPLFHWLAKQAYAELKLISQIEWPDHDIKYSSI